MARRSCRMASAASSSRIRTASVISSSSRLAGEAGFGQRRHHLQRQRAAPELNRRDVDGEADVAGPACGFPAGGVQHPFAELVDQAGVLGQRDELGGRNHAALRMAPAHQRLAAGDRVGLQVDAGLVVDLEAAVDQRLAQIDFQAAAGADLGLHVGFEEAIGAAAGGLGRIHRQIRVLQDPVDVGAVARRHARYRCWRRW